MKIQSFQYIQNQGWSIEKFPELDSTNTLILVFASPAFRTNTKPIQELAQAYKKSKIIGCSTAGEIFGPDIFDNSIAVAVAQFESTTLQLAKAEVKNAEESLGAGAQLAKSLHQNQNPKGIFVLSDGLNVNGSELIKGLNKNSAKEVTITGGLAGDGADFKNTWIIYDGKIIDHCIVAVGLYGDQIHVGHGSRGGWDIFGPERMITRSKGNILYELDNQPALKLYKTYLGDRASELPAAGLLYPLAIRNPSDPDSQHIVRTILGIDETSQSLTFAGDLPQGYYAQLMRANFDRLIESANEAGEAANKILFKNNGLNQKPVLAIDISCVGRRLLLGGRAEEETETTFQSILDGSIQIGFYSYGELSPLTVGNCELHNQTMTITTLLESS
ncbi:MULTISPECIES: FIST signal transduction protein [unclassified Legionella]|uniref:FIST signal transduction protein n=1 Tax=unclassified Legionella TaxID=2622702 RepID=UPI001E49E1AC|nr:FIST N-terminal domain-containing protein [Legionella sp. 31fI33]MCC5013829.1 FIST C-terminal domain-containing protein [Legionella sp. 31fI33]